MSNYKFLFEACKQHKEVSVFIPSLIPPYRAEIKGEILLVDDEETVIDTKKGPYTVKLHNIKGMIKYE